MHTIAQKSVACRYASHSHAGEKKPGLPPARLAVRAVRKMPGLKTRPATSAAMVAFGLLPAHLGTGVALNALQTRLVQP